MEEVHMGWNKNKQKSTFQRSPSMLLSSPPSYSITLSFLSSLLLPHTFSSLLPPTPLHLPSSPPSYSITPSLLSSLLLHHTFPPLLPPTPSHLPSSPSSLPFSLTCTAYLYHWAAHLLLSVVQCRSENGCCQI